MRAWLWGWILLGALGCDDGAAAVDMAFSTDSFALDVAVMDAANDADSALDGDQFVADAGADREVDGSISMDLAFDAQARDAEPPDADQAPDAGPDAVPDVADAALPDVPAEPREIACFDGLDDDDDGRVDCADPDCRNTGACFGVVEDCGDGIDNTGDDHVDCEDVTCVDECPVPDVPAFTDEELQALFLARCAPCHLGEGSDGAMRLDPPFRDAIVNVISSQVPELRVKPGDRFNSYLYRKVAYTFRDVPGGGGEGMPPVEPLSATELERLGRWIDAL